MRQLGKILWWDRRDAEGVIVDKNGTEFHFNSSVFQNHSKHKSIEGYFVEFSINETVSHTRCACNVELLSKSAQSRAKQTFESAPGKSAERAV